MAEQLLRDHREQADVGNEPRILIVSPYSEHARLLQIMIEEQKLSAEVRAGTAHSFHACEADVVIFDLVDDEPQAAAMFMADHDRDMKRLVTVAMTRQGVGWW
jgi:superfamily I DNA and/or RNA helicase